MEINITYETLFELLRRERAREELQELGETFLVDLAHYLNAKKGQLGGGTPEQQKKAATELENINRILTELYQKRERKIMNSALSSSRAGTDIIEGSKLLPKEKEFYDEMKGLLNRYRQDILGKILAAEEPAEAELAEEKKTVLVRFLQPVPKFIGKELETYGPFDKEDMVELPSEIADVLIKKSRAEAISDA